MKLASSFVFAFFASFSAFAQDSAAPLVLQAFQNSCSTSGKWSEAALNQNNAMRSVIETLKNQDPCKPFAGKLAVIQSTTQQIEAILQDQKYVDYRMAEEKLQNLMLALQGTTNQEMITLMGQQIVIAQVGLAESRAAYQTNKDQNGKDQYQRATLALNQYVQGLLTDSGGLAACLQSSPGAAVQLSSNLTALGGSFVSPIYGAAAAVIGQIANLGIEYFRTRQKEREIYKLYSAQMPSALTCGLESMTNLYCQAGDAFKLLELQTKKIDSTKPVHPVWSNIDVLKRQLPMLENWLQKVRNGVVPGDPNEANRQNAIWQKVHFVESMNRYVQGVLNYQEQLYNSETNIAEKQKILLSVLVSLTNEILPSSSGNFKSPFTEYSSDRYEISCYLGLGTNQGCPTPAVGESLDSFVKKLTGLKDFGALFVNWEKFFAAVDRRVANEFNQSIAMDPSSILASAFEVDKQKISPVSSTKAMIAFLERLQQSTPDHMSARKQLIFETVELLNKFIDLINGQNIQNSKDQIRDIFKLFQLGQNSKFLHDRISDFVKYDLTDHLHAGSFPEDAQDILISGAMDIRTRLEASGVTKDASEADLNNARTLSAGNIDAFNSFFADAAGKTLENLWQKQKASGEPATGTNRHYGQSLARLCLFQLVTRTDWPRDMNWAYCQDAVLYSAYSRNGEPMKLKLSEVKAKVSSMPVADRMCIYQKFIRDGRVAEMLEDKNALIRRLQFGHLSAPQGSLR